MKARSRGGTGSIRERQAGHWEVRWRSDGKQRSHMVVGTRVEAQKWLTAQQKAADDGLATTPSRITLAAFLTRWLAQRGKDPSWYRINGDSARHWNTAIGGVKLQELTALHVQEARDLMLEDKWQDGASAGTAGTTTAALSGARRSRTRGHATMATGSARAGALSPKTVSNDVAALRTALKWAMKMGYVSRNVALDVDLPGVERVPIEPLTVDEAGRLLAVLRDWERSETNMLAAGLMLGVRTYSELGGVRRADLDLQKRTLVLDQMLRGQVLTTDKAGKRHASQQLAPAGNRKHKRRTLEVPEALVPFLERQEAWLKRQHASCGLGWNPNRLLFPNGYGEPQHPSTLRNVFKKALAEAGLRDARIHDLRHTCATLLLATGASMKTVQAVLGHATYRQTADTYSHLLAGEVRGALNGLWTARESVV